MKEALLVESGFVEVTQPKQFPVQRSVTADPNEMLTLKFFCGSSNRKIKGLVWEEDGFLLIYKLAGGGNFSMAPIGSGSPEHHFGAVSSAHERILHRSICP